MDEYLTRLTVAPTRPWGDLMLDREQAEARAHVIERIEIDGAHDINHCPRHTRAICSYKRTIQTMRPEDFS